MNVIERATSILLKPSATWGTIDTESTDVVRLYTGYLMILAAIPAVCGFIGLSLVGVGGFGMSFKVPVVSGLINMVVGYAMTLVMVFVLALIVNALAPIFGGVSNQLQALKVVVYSMTAAMLAGVFSLIPMLGMLGLVASLYSIYLLYTGLPVLMKSPQAKSIAYTAVVIVVAFVMGVAMAAVSAMLRPTPGGFGGVSGDGADVSIKTPGGEVKIDAAGMAAAQRAMEQAARNMEKAAEQKDPAATAAAAGAAATAAAGMLGGGKAIAAQALKAALPEQLGGLARTGFDVQDGAALGLPTSQASAKYGSGDRTVEVEIVDLGGLGAMAAAAFGMVQGEKEDESHVEKTWQENGRTLHESYSKDGGAAERKVMLKNGLIVSISGENMDIAAVRSMAGQFDVTALEKLERPAK